jgi:glycosyltransferase involved in cell wall biosynthesis
MSPEHQVAAGRESRMEGGRRVSGVLRAKNDGPVITIITIVRNDEANLDSTIQSVLSQTYTNIEYIIIDGASTDGSLDSIKKYEDRIDYWLSEPDDGISDAFNKGLSLSRGDWVIFLNSADTFPKPDTLARMAVHFSKSRIITGFAWTGRKLLPKRKLENEEPLPVRSMIAHQASIVHRSIFQTYGDFDKQFAVRMDYDFWLRVLRHETFYFLDEVLVNFAEGGRSGSNVRRYFIEEYRANKKNLGRYRFWSWPRIKFLLERFLNN